MYNGFKRPRYDTGHPYDILTLGISVCVLWLEFMDLVGYDDNQTQVCVCKRWFMVWLEAQFPPDDGLTWKSEGKEVRNNMAQDLNLFKMLKKNILCFIIFQGCNII